MMDNMPPFLIGKARFAKGPFPHESKAHGLREYRAEIGGELARVLLQDGLDRGVLRSLESEGVWNKLKR